MIVEVTPATVSAVAGTLVALGGALVAVGNLQWFKRAEGTDLSRAVTSLTETVRNLSRLDGVIQTEGLKREESDRRVHARIDDLAKDLQRVVGALEGRKP